MADASRCIFVYMTDISICFRNVSQGCFSAQHQLFIYPLFVNFLHSWSRLSVEKSSNKERKKVTM